jgi:hypothetical protein
MLINNLYSALFEFLTADKKTEVVDFKLLLPQGNASPPKGAQK